MPFESKPTDLFKEFGRQFIDQILQSIQLKQISAKK